MVETRAGFIRQEAINRARADYGLHPYTPDYPCKILGTSIHYACGCGYQTTSSGDIFDHCAGVACVKKTEGGDP